MRDGFIKAAAATPHVTVGDCVSNANEILKLIRRLDAKNVKLMVFPELGLTGYTCSDLFLQEHLVREAKHQLFRIMTETSTVDALIFIGLPLEVRGKLYNVAAVINRGCLLGIVPKKNLPNYNEFYERRQFTPAPDGITYLSISRLFSEELAKFNNNYRSSGEANVDPSSRYPVVPFGTNLLFSCVSLRHLCVAAEICEDLWVPCPPSISHAAAGANIIVNLSASNDMIGKSTYRRQLVTSQSASLISGYIYASAGEGESTTDLVFGGHNLIAENGTLLSETPSFVADEMGSIACSEIDVDRLMSERRRTSTYPSATESIWFDRDNADLMYGTGSSFLGHLMIPFDLRIEKTALTRRFDPHPFVPSNASEREKRCNEILNIQAYGLKKRLAHTHASSAVIGLSGGLDSTLALLVTVRAFDLLGLDRSGIVAVTMPCFGTTDRTYNNACLLAKSLNVTLKEVNIKEAVTIHFRDIEHDIDKHDVTYENGQARERTQILMDIANQSGGLVIGTGDLSELALGWATYNGDHMSMYGVNATIPKTLVRHLVHYYADFSETISLDGRKDHALTEVLLDILDTPVSPELLPPKDGVISQKTEDLVGPYELHDFYLYYMIRVGFPPKKIFRVALETFKETYGRETILKWLKTFYRRFFAQQFKRSCLPDGPKVGSVALSPRGDWRMPSDASARTWLEEIEALS